MTKTTQQSTDASTVEGESRRGDARTQRRWKPSSSVTKGDAAERRRRLRSKMNHYTRLCVPLVSDDLMRKALKRRLGEGRRMSAGAARLANQGLDLWLVPLLQAARQSAALRKHDRIRLADVNLVLQVQQLMGAGLGDKPLVAEPVSDSS